MKKIKVLHIIKSLGKGGAEVLLPETLHFHNKEFFEFHYIYFLPWKNDVVREIEESGGIVHCLNIKSNIGILLKSSYKIYNYCKKNKIDIIHFHSPILSTPVRLLKLILKIPICYTEHSLVNKYKNFTRKLNYLTYNLQDCVIACSDVVKDSIVKNIKNIKVPILKISNGINSDKYKPSTNLPFKLKLNIPKNAVVIMIIAVLRKEKRINLWLDIINKAISKNDNIYGLIVGGGPLEEDLKAQHQTLKNKNHILFVGKQLNVKPYLDISDIFMMTSDFEGLPISLLEAMSSGLAVVSTNAGGIKSVIRNGVDGLTSDVDNSQELINHIEKLAENKEILEKYKKTARDRVVHSFSLQTMTKELENLYVKLYNGNKKI